MTSSLTSQYIDHSLNFVILTLAICILVAWPIAMLLDKITTTSAPQRPLWFIGAAVATGLGVWIVHFIAIRGYHPEMFLSYEATGMMTAAGVAILAVGLPLAASAAASTMMWRVSLGGIAGVGLAAKHYIAMAAAINCVQRYSAGSVVLAICTGGACLALAQGLQEHRRRTMSVCCLLTLAICGSHFIASSGTTLETAGGINRHWLHSSNLSTPLGTAVVFGGALLVILAAKYFAASDHFNLRPASPYGMSRGLLVFDAKERENRLWLHQYIEQGFSCDQDLSLLLIGLDRLKMVNRTYGDEASDSIWIAVAERIRAIAGLEGFAVRLRDDEIALLLYHDPDTSRAVAQQIIEDINRPILIGSLAVTIACNIGLCGAGSAGSPAILMLQADVALYEAKRLGRGRTCDYRPGMLKAITERQILETDMHRAIERGEFYLEYQPIVALKSERVIGYEALIRWNHQTLGPLPPALFIPLAEETGQIIAIGRWALEEACREAAAWSNDCHVAVNISPVQFRSPLLLSHLKNALSRSGLKPEKLEIELTETALMEDRVLIAARLAEIRTFGLKVALDDFGTGYSSLADIRDFPADRIKIDRSFVTTAPANRHSMAVLRGITGIARELGVAIVAEGVETQEQLDLLRSIGCDAAQGYLLGHPRRGPDTIA